MIIGVGRGALYVNEHKARPPNAAEERFDAALAPELRVAAGAGADTGRQHAGRIAVNTGVARTTMSDGKNVAFETHAIRRERADAPRETSLCAPAH